MVKKVREEDAGSKHGLSDPYKDKQYGEPPEPGGERDPGLVTVDDTASNFLSANDLKKRVRKTGIVAGKYQKNPETGLSKHETNIDEELEDIKRRAGIKSDS